MSDAAENNSAASEVSAKRTSLEGSASETAALLFGTSAPLIYIALRQIERIRYGAPSAESMLGDGAFIGRALIALWAAAVLSVGLAKLELTSLRRVAASPLTLAVVVVLVLGFSLFAP